MIGLIFLGLAVLGCLYLGATVVMIASRRNDEAGAPSDRPVTVLKPLHGDEPALRSNLDDLCRQHYAGPIQIICGVQSDEDTAIPVVRRLQQERPDIDIRLVIDGTEHGANRKVANLINMMRLAKHEVIVIADSDIGVGPSYLSRITAPLADRSVGAVTCLYHGASVAGLWGRLSALAIDTHFLPNVLVGLGFGLAQPCFGSTIVLSRTCLSQIGGFESFSDLLADDYAIGAAVRKKGFRIAIPEMLVTHHCSETSLSELWKHEIRWGRTILGVDPAGYAGSLITHPLGWACVAVLAGQWSFGLAAGALGVCLRIAVACAVARRFGLAPPPCWLIPARDLLSFTIYIGSFIGRSIAWRGRHYNMSARGRLTAD